MGIYCSCRSDTLKMMGKVSISAILFLALSAWAPSVEANVYDTRVVCYVDTSAHRRTGAGAFNIANIDASMCTDAVYGFVGVSSWTYEVEMLDPYYDECSQFSSSYKCAMRNFSKDLFNTNPGVKLWLGIGG